MNLRVEYVRPRSGRFLGREAAERATKSREVDLSRLKGFHLRFALKMRGGVTWNLEVECYIPTKTISNVCAFLLLRQKGKLNLFTLFLSDSEQRFKRKLTI